MSLTEIGSRYAWVLAVVVVLLCYRFIMRGLGGTVVIPQNAIGIVTKKWALGAHRSLPNGDLIALQGEAGIQADTLAPGIYFGLWAWQYSVAKVPFTVIEQGKIGIVEARDGHAISGGRISAKSVDCNSFQDARAFLQNGGQRGPQITIVPPGSYRINTLLFTVIAAAVTEIPDNTVGIVTTKDGAPLATGEIAGKEVTGHNMFQDGESFITNGGHRGLQEQVMLAGRYFINPRFATVETAPMTSVPIATVGVVIAYVGEEGKDVSGDGFKHGNLVSRGQKGVWVDVLDPGRYPVNPYTHKVETVPTANIVLNWATGKTEAHKLDERLSTITVRSCDGFTFNLDVSQIIHVPHNDAPKVIARFGTMANLVTQVLEPTIGNYFRNAAQSSDVIEFLRQRTQRQSEAKDAIRAALIEYNVNAIDTLIGDITPPEALMKTLTDRKIAEQALVTYGTQRLAEDGRKDLEQARAMAETQSRVVDAERRVQIAEFEANAKIKTADGDAKSKTINASADAEVRANLADGDARALIKSSESQATAKATMAEGEAKARVFNAKGDAEARTLNAEAEATAIKVIGSAEAAKIDAIGGAEASVIKMKIESMEPGNYAAIQIAKAFAEGHVKLVPDVMVGSASGAAGTIVDVLMANLVRSGLERKIE